MKSKLFFLYFILFISSNFVFAQSNEDCMDCHSDNEMTYERHGKEVSLYVSERVFNNSAHKNVKCIDCHSGFNIDDIPHKEGNDIYKVNCAKCHSRIGNQQKSDIHHRLKLVNKNKKFPDCLSCHSYHGVKPIKTISDKNKYFCSKCHTDSKNATGFHDKVYVDNDQCADCHDEVEEFSEKLSKSVHSNLACADCHTYAAANLDSHDSDPDLAIKATCETCHKTIYEEHKKSIHGIKLAEGVKEAAHCYNCHGSHEILKVTNPNSKVYPKNLAQTCGSCHDDPAFEEKFNMSIVRPGKMYSQSVHGKHVSKGDMKAANCSTCHGVHDIKNRVQEGSKISPINLPNTCEQCHEKEVKAYKKSIHWLLVRRGIKDAPVCNDCHNEHNIVEITNKGRENNRLKMQQETCIACHENSRVAEKYGKVEHQVEQYLNSYHGLAATRGDKDAALCIDCHNVHDILPSKDPNSSVNQANVTKTCQRCHKDATEVFAQSYTHKTESESARSVQKVVSNIYFWLIIAVIGGMFIHNLLIFLFETRRKRRKEKNAIRMPRFTKNEVIQHILLAVSFIVLAITGFALKYPNSFWAEGLLSLGLTEPIRQNTHRVSAVVMIVLSLYHVFYLAFTARGRDIFKEMLPKFKDISDITENISYYLRLSKKSPEFETYDYTEKAEYWALIWGTFVMALSGLILWFPTMVGDWAPVWLIKVSEIVHFMEAILASLAILIWHWFFVIYRPSEYPMNFTWTDGKMTLEHYRHHHERHFKRIVLEWYEYNLDQHPRIKLTNYTKLFKNVLEKNGYDLESIIQGELNKDLELRQWYEEETEKINQSLA